MVRLDLFPLCMAPERRGGGGRGGLDSRGRERGMEGKGERGGGGREGGGERRGGGRGGGRERGGGGRKGGRERGGERKREGRGCLTAHHLHLSINLSLMLHQLNIQPIRSTLWREWEEERVVRSSQGM